MHIRTSQAALVKNPPASAGDVRDVGSIPGWGRSPGEGNGNPLQYSCLEKPMGRGAWRVIVHETIAIFHRTCSAGWKAIEFFIKAPFRSKVLITSWCRKRLDVV